MLEYKWLYTFVARVIVLPVLILIAITSVTRVDAAPTQQIDEQRTFDAVIVQTSRLGSHIARDCRSGDMIDLGDFSSSSPVTFVKVEQGHTYHFENLRIWEGNGPGKGLFALGMESPGFRYWEISGCPSAPPPAAPPSVNFYVDQNNLTQGQCATLRWDVDNVRAVYVDGQGVAGHDSRYVCPQSSTTYNLRAVTNSGDINRSVAINVQIPQPQIVFTADQTSINQGSCTTLRWALAYVQSMSLDYSAISNPGTRQVCPAKTTTYTLRAGSSYGEINRSITLQVIPPTPTPTPIPTPTPTVAGPPRRVLLLLAGMSTSSSDVRKMYTSILSQIGGQYDDILYFSYRGDGADYQPLDTYIGVWNSSQVLRKQVEDYVSKYPNAKIDLIGHSLGGVVAMNYVSVAGLRAPVAGHIGIVITLDSPVNGSSLLNIRLKSDNWTRLSGNLGEVLTRLPNIWGMNGVTSQAALDLADMAKDQTGLEYENAASIRALKSKGVTVWTLTNADDNYILVSDAIVEGFGFACSLGNSMSTGGHSEIFNNDDVARDIKGLMNGMDRVTNCPGSSKAKQIAFSAGGRPFTNLRVVGENQYQDETTWVDPETFGKTVALTQGYWWQGTTVLTFNIKDVGWRGCVIEYLSDVESGSSVAITYNESTGCSGGGNSAGVVIPESAVKDYSGDTAPLIPFKCLKAVAKASSNAVTQNAPGAAVDTIKLGYDCLISPGLWIAKMLAAAHNKSIDSTDGASTDSSSSASTTLSPTTAMPSSTLPPSSSTAGLPTVVPPPPGVYVTKVRMEPANPNAVQDIRFFVTFWNTAGPLQFKWCVYIYNPGSQNPRGQTSCNAFVDFPLGVYEYSTPNTWKLGTGVPCADVTARVEGVETNGSKLIFKTPEFSENSLSFRVCP